jgi:hypothetical protein
LAARQVLKFSDAGVRVVIGVVDGTYALKLIDILVAVFKLNGAVGKFAKLAVVKLINRPGVDKRIP